MRSLPTVTLAFAGAILGVTVVASSARQAAPVSPPSAPPAVPAPSSRPHAPGPAGPAARLAPAPATEADRTVVQSYCVGCHSDRGKAGGLSLASFDPARAAESPEIAGEDRPQAVGRDDAAGRARSGPTPRSLTRSSSAASKRGSIAPRLRARTPGGVPSSG